MDHIASSTPAKHKPRALFNGLTFHVVESKQLSQERAKELSDLLIRNGASPNPTSSNVKFALEHVTHIIASSVDFEEYEAAQELFKPVVTPEWISFCLEKGRLANPRSYNADPRMIFSGLVFWTAGLPDGTRDAMAAGILAMGGLYTSSLSRAVTHILSSGLDAEFGNVKLGNCKVVREQWFNDCLRFGRRLREDEYLVSGSRSAQEKSNDQASSEQLHSEDTHIDDPASPPPPKQERAGLKVFQNRKVMLSKDLGLDQSLRTTLEDLIIKGQGKLIKRSIDDADTLICRYRAGPEYKSASLAGKVVGNLAWLYHLITYNTWTSPLSRLLHYPICRDGLPGFKDYRISLSNYNGEGRNYLENLAIAAGCEFSRVMVETNTHLITPYLGSEKCDAAKEWNVRVVNHLWLEESYAKWQIQTEDDSRYTCFPPSATTAGVVGQTSINEEALERNFFPKTKGAKDSEPENDTAAISTKSKVQPATPMPTRPNRKSHSAGSTPGVGKIGATVQTPTPTPSHLTFADKENETPSSTGCRGAKSRAVAALHGLASDIALYEKERKRVGGVLYGGRRAKEDLVDTPKRKRDPSDESGSGSDDDSGAGPQISAAKEGIKRRRQSRSHASMCLLVSGYASWTEGSTWRPDKARLEEIGIYLTDKYTKCTHVAVCKILRTTKFICAMSRGPVLLSIEYIKQCLAQSKFLDPNDFLLDDPEGEERYGLNLQDARQRAQSNRGRLLEGKQIYCGETIHGGFESYQAIVEANGGTCTLLKPRAGTIRGDASSSFGGGPVDNTDDEDSANEIGFMYLLSGTRPEDAKLWPRFRSVCQATRKRPRIVAADWLLDVALGQSNIWNHKYELSERDIVA